MASSSPELYDGHGVLKEQWERAVAADREPGAFGTVDLGGNGSPAVWAL